MSVYLYDTAIVNNLRSILNDPRIHIMPPDNMFRNISILEKDNIELPVISIQRTGWSISDNRNHALKFNGSVVEVSDEDNDTILTDLRCMPISINYLMDVWTKNREENDNILRELIFYYSTHPTMKVDIPYGLDMQHNFNIFFNNDIEDNSDIVDHPNKGELFRQTVAFYTDDAYLWLSANRKRVIINPVDIIDGNSGYLIDTVNLLQEGETNDRNS